MKNNNLKKYILILIIAIILIISLGTYAWLTYRTNDTAMVLTIGDIETMRITVEKYQINESIAPVLAYTNGVEVDVNMANNGSNTGKGRLYYQINKIDAPLQNANFKWTIEKSTDGENYEVYKEGDFSSATTTEELTILEDDVPTGETYNYKVYVWLDGSSSSNLTEGSVFNGELRAEILTHYLYDVLKRAAADGTYAREYTGAHQDSMDASKSTQKIYYWYGSSSANGASISNMNNVIFGNHCWQMIRTTDTGGVRMIYNGEPENDACLDTRGTHVGYSSRTSVSLSSGNYYYGTSYSYDKTNNVFSLTGTTTQSAWNATTASTLVGKYTCRETTAQATCATLYLVESFRDYSMGNVIPISNTSHYSQFGTLQFNAQYNSPAYVGYMYNTVYPITSKQHTYYVIENSAITLNNNHYYASSIDYGNIVSGKYTLTNPQLISSLTNTSDLVGKYILNNGSSASDTGARYIVAVSGTSLYYHYLTGGDLSTSLMIGDSYQFSNNTYTITNASQVSYIDWYNSTDATRDTYKYKYVCDGDSASCSNLKHIANNRPTKNYYYYYSSASDTYKYSESVNYSNGEYTLTGDIQTVWDLPDSTELNKINTHHYTCLSMNTSCASVNYVNYYSNVSLYYAELSSVSNIAVALTNMLSVSDVNAKNSIIKTGIEEWYKNYLYPNFDEYIDDTIYCNNRRISALGAWSPSSSSITSSSAYLQFQEYTGENDLSCANATDSFSVSNSSAHLTYKVALMSSSEMKLLYNNKIRYTGQSFWLVSPSHSGQSTSGRYVNLDGSMSNSNINSAIGVRPAISLISGIEYTEGDGSMAHPYIVSAGT